MMPSWDKWMYDLLYRFTTPGWDHGIVAPEVVSLIENESAQGRALDLGCGTGTQSIYLAQRGMNVVGVDFSPKAIALAREKAKRAGVAIDFQISDVTRLDFLCEPFDLAFDIGCFHGLDAAGRRRYIDHLSRLVRPGGRFLLYAFDEPLHFGNFGIPRAQVERVFASYFIIQRTEPGPRRYQRPSTWYWMKHQ